MAWTSQDLATLDKAFSSGAEEIDYGDKKVKFRSVSEYKRLRDMMLQDINNKPGVAPKRIYTEFSKGIL